MAGSAGIAAAVAQIAFWVLLAKAWAERGARTAALFAALWVAGYVGLPLVGAPLFVTSYVAVLDIALVFLVVYGDAPLS